MLGVPVCDTRHRLSLLCREPSTGGGGREEAPGCWEPPGGCRGMCVGYLTSFPPECTAEAPCSGILSFPGDGQVWSLPRMLLCYPTVPQLHPVTPVIINNSDFKKGVLRAGRPGMPASCYALPIPTGDALTQDSSRVLFDCGPGWMCWELAGARNFSSSAPTSFAGFLGGPRGGEGSLGSEPAPANTGAARLQRLGRGARPAHNCDLSVPRGAPRGHPASGLQACLGCGLLLGGVDRGPYSFVSGPQAG